MVALVNGEFEFRGVQFGSTRSGYPLREGGFSVGATTFRDQDDDNPSGDGVVFGRDSLHGAKYSFDLWVIEEESDAGWAAASRKMSTFRNMWHGSVNRNVSRAVDELKLWHGDSVGLVFGRARNYAEDRTRLRKGYGAIACDFAAVDDLIYSELWKVHTLSLVVAATGGLKAPLRAPLVGANINSSRPGFFDVLGDAPAPVLIHFTGPIVFPRLTIVGGWTVMLNVALAAGQWAQVDARLWARRVLKNDGSSLGGTISRDSAPLDQMVIQPGTREMVFTGIDDTNTATASLYWRDARRSV